MSIAFSQSTFSVIPNFPRTTMAAGFWLQEKTACNLKLVAGDLVANNSRSSKLKARDYL
jgi:hypothetical protein